MLRRLIKHGIAIGTGQGLNILQQLLLPPAFLYFYGVEIYGAWLIMTAGIAHLNTLDFGLQTYVTNRLGMLHHTNQFDAFRRLQSIGLRLVLGIVAVAALLLIPVLFLPLESWLKLTVVGPMARLTMFLLALGLLVQIIFGQLTGVFRATGHAHRAQHFSNLQRAITLPALLVLIALRVPPVWLAVALLTISVTMLITVICDMRSRFPQHAPTLNEWDAAEAKRMLKPSLFFGLGVLNNFMLFEVPLLVLQQTVGPLAVVTFATTRTLFSAGRQLLTPVQYSLIPEITRLHAVKDRATLVNMYRCSEGVAIIGGLTLVASVGLASGVILPAWLRNQVLPSPLFIALMGAVTLLTICRESKFLFQLATNRHEENMVVTWLSYAGMAVLGWSLGSSLSGEGMLVAWLLAELVIIAFLQRENFRLLEENPAGSHLLLLAVLASLFVLLYAGLPLTASAGVLVKSLFAAVAGLGIGTMALFAIGRPLFPLIARASQQLLSPRKI